MAKWKRLSLYAFKFTKVSKVFVLPARIEEERFYSCPYIEVYLRVGCTLTLYTNGEGLYRLRKDGELLCEGDEFALACAVARLENAFYEENEKYSRGGKSFIVDGEWP